MTDLTIEASQLSHDIGKKGRKGEQIMGNGIPKKGTEILVDPRRREEKSRTRQKH